MLDQCQYPESLKKKKKKIPFISFRPRPSLLIKSAKVQLTITNSLDQMSVVLSVCVRVLESKTFYASCYCVLFGPQTGGSKDEKDGQHQVYANKV